MNQDNNKVISKDHFSLFIRLWRLIPFRRRKQLAFLLIIMVLTSMAEIASIGAVLPFLSVLISPEMLFNHNLARPIIELLSITDVNQLLLPLTVFFMIAVVISGLMRFILLYMKLRLGNSIGTEFSTSIYKKTLYQPYPIHIARNSSEVISGVLSKNTSVIGETIMPLLNVFSSTLTLIFILSILMVIKPTIALTIFGILGTFYSLISFTVKKRVESNSKRINQEYGKIVKVLQEGLGGIRDILIDGTQSTFCEIYARAETSLRRSQANINIISGSPRFIIEVLCVCLIAILALMMSPHKNPTAIPILGAIVIAAQRIFPLLQDLYFSLTGIRAGKSSLQDVLELLEQPLPSFADSSSPLSEIPFEKLIRLNEVGFRHIEKKDWTLKNINFEIKKGARIGIIGTTGSGKSTLLDLIMGLLIPTEGTITIDEIVISEKHMHSWRKHIAHVPQNIILVDSSVAENIAFGVPSEKIDMERVRKVASHAQISTTIESWNHQYQTRVGERGLRLSGGQRQRIGIARALYKGADVFIFDEATSALDSDTENLVMEAIENISNEVTIFMVSHRLSTLKNCDLIFQLMEGRIIHIGKYSEMASRK